MRTQDRENPREGAAIPSKVHSDLTTGSSKYRYLMKRYPSREALNKLLSQCPVIASNFMI